MSERIDGDNIIVTGYSGGSHYPRTQAATQYRFEADGLSPEGPYQIDGSIYGRDLRFRGPGTVSGPVMGRGDVSLLPTPQKAAGLVQRFMGGLHANGNIGSTSRGGGLRSSLAADVTRADTVIRGDVIGENVTLENAVVFGNVRGRQLRLTHSIVFGQVLAKEAAFLTASTVLSYDCPEITFAGPCAMLFAMGTSVGPPKFEEYRDGAGETWACDLRYYPASRSARSSAMTNRPWERSPGDDLARLYPSDWVRVQGELPTFKHRNGKMVEERSVVERCVLTLAGRALNLKALQDNVDVLTLLLKSALEFDHYHPTTQQDVRAKWAASLSKDEEYLLRLATDPFLAPDHPAAVASELALRAP